MRTVKAQFVFKSSPVRLEGDAMASQGLYSADYLLSSDEPVASWRYQYVKRFFDVGCSVALIAAFAIPGLLIAATILLTTGGRSFIGSKGWDETGGPSNL